MTKTVFMGLVVAVAAVFAAQPVNAQRVDSKARQKSTWYNAPREFQIVDERPVIRDFREAPEAPGSIDLPPGPAGWGAGGGGGSGALGPGGGMLPAGGMPMGGPDGGGGPGGGGAGALGPGSGTLPPNGLQVGGPNQGFRNAPNALRSLPHSGFNRPENSNMRSLRTPSGLQNGQSTNLLGKMFAPKPGAGMGAGPSRGMTPGAARPGNYTGPAVQSYNGGYATGSGSGYGGSASRTETMVRGTLLRKR